MKLSKQIAKYKIYLDRSRTYISYVQLAMILKIFLTSLGIESNLYFAGGIVVAFVGLFIVGYLDTRLGIRSREMENNAHTNPVIKEIHKKVNELCNK